MELFRNINLIVEDYEHWCHNVKSMLISAKTNSKVNLNYLKDIFSFANERKYSKTSSIYVFLKALIHEVESYSKIAKLLVHQFKKPDYNNCEVILKSEHTQLKLNIEQLKEFYSRIIELPCVLDEAESLSAIILEVLDFEKNAKRCIDDKILDTKILKKYVEYFQRVNIDLDSVLSLLKNQYQEALWIERVNFLISNFELPSLHQINEIIIAATELKSHIYIEKTLIDLQELYLLAKKWDEKAKVQLEATNGLIFINFFKAEK